MEFGPLLRAFSISKMRKVWIAALHKHTKRITSDHPTKFYPAKNFHVEDRKSTLYCTHLLLHPMVQWGDTENDTFFAALRLTPYKLDEAPQTKTNCQRNISWTSFNSFHEVSKISDNRKFRQLFLIFLKKSCFFTFLKVVFFTLKFS